MGNNFSLMQIGCLKHVLPLVRRFDGNQIAFQWLSVIWVWLISP